MTEPRRDAEAQTSDPAADPGLVVRLRSERDALRRRALEAESIAEQLADELAATRRQLSRMRRDAGLPPVTDSALPFLGGTGAGASGATPDGRAAGPRGDSSPAEAAADEPAPAGYTAPRISDGSDPTVLPLALGGLALVGVMVTFLSVLNNGVLSLVSLAFLLITAGVGWAAWSTRVVRTTVEIGSDGVVEIARRGSSYRFDLAKDATQVDVYGDSDDPDWQVVFPRRGLDACVVDGSMVDPAEFMAALRRFRPGL